MELIKGLILLGSTDLPDREGGKVRQRTGVAPEEDQHCSGEQRLPRFVFLASPAATSMSICLGSMIRHN